MSALFDTAPIAAAWRRREDLRASRADAPALIAKRHLDIVRIEMMRVRGY